MKITLPARRLRELFALAATAVSSRCPREVTKSVLVDLDKGSCTGTDLERWIVAQDDAIATKNGRFLIDAQRGVRMLDAIRSDELSLDIKSARITLSGGGAKFDLPTIDPSDFPSCPEPRNAILEVKIPAATLIGGLARTKVAADSESSRYQMQSVCIGACGVVELVATDGHRACRTLTEIKASNDTRFLLPLPTVAAIQRAFADCAGDVTLHLETSAVVVSNDCLSIRSPLMEGAFPRTEELFWLGDDPTGSVPAEVLANAMETASLVCQRDAEGDLIESVDISTRIGELVFRARGAEVGSSEIAIPAQVREFKDFTLNSRYVRDWLRAIGKGALVDVYFSEAPEGPARFRHLDCTLVVMPMRTEA